MTSSNLHLPDFEQIDAYIAGGLSRDERAAFESHLQDCPACRIAVEAAQSSDSALRQLFNTARPAAGFEDRLIQGLREDRSSRLRLPLPVRRAAAIAAAVMLVGGVGYFGNHLMNGGSLLNHVLEASNLEQFGKAMLLNSNEKNAEVFVPSASKAEKWEFGGGAGTSQNWLNWQDDGNRQRSDPSYSNENQFSSGKPVSLGWRLNTSLPSDYAAASDIKSQSSSGEESSERSKFPALKPASEQLADGLLGGLETSHSAAKPKNLYFRLADHDSDAVAELDAKSKPSKSGNGTVTLNGSNLYAGGTVISNGTYALGNTSSTPNLDITAASQSQQGGRGVALGRVVDVPAQVAFVVNATAAPAGDAPPPPMPQAPPATAPADTRKIIRNGTMEFEVDSFDSALAKISQITTESGGYVGNTDSTKLPNGKVKGTITLRVPPERLDVLVLSLRALGDLKSQQITAQDITKQYTDLQSQLTAARAMESRLLDLIKSGNGAIKDLLAAEKELGVWREKIEQAEGEIRYYNSLVSMSTLSITLYERDIKTPAAAVETETADVGIEAEDVEHARTEATKVIDDVKGRVVESELKRFDAGQLAARIVADVPPDQAGGAIDRLKQLGRVARLEVHRQQTTAEGSEPTTAPAGSTLRVDRKPTRLLISLYNLANVAPRKTTNVTVAAGDVEASYTALLAQAKADGSRIVTSNLDRGDPAKASGSIVLEIAPQKLDAAMSALRSQGDMLKRAVVENADTQNTTDSKHGLTIQLVSLASVQSRETVQQVLATSDVPSAYHAILDAATAAHARVRTAQLDEQDRQNISGTIEVEVLRAESGAVDKAIASSGEIVSRAGSRSSDAENTVDSKVLLQMRVVAADRLPPRETTQLEVEVTDAAKAAGDAQTAAVATGGTVADAVINRDRTGRQTAHIALDIPLAKAGDVLNELRNTGVVRAIESSRDMHAPAGALAHARIDATFATADALVTSESGLWPTIRNGLATSVMGLMLSVKLIVIGLCLVLPWVVVLWLVWRIWRRGKRRAASTS